MKKVVVGGTFNILHKGHRMLLRRAYQLGEVTIGLTSDEISRKTRQKKVKSFEQRKKDLKSLIQKELKLKPSIRKIKNGFDFSLTQDFDYIIVSPETYKSALLINKERQKIKRKPIKIVKIDFVLGEDRKAISSTRIFNGEIDKEGKLLKNIKHD